MGHAVLMMPEIDAALTFYRDLLGFRITDFMGPPVSLYFMHVNTRHHSLAIAQGPRSRMHHLMMEFYSLDDVGQSYDIAQREDRVAVKFGRHPNDFMTSFYMRTPSNFLIEHGWGGREVSTGWQPVELKSVGSFWGHQGLFESLGEGPPPPDAPPHPPMPAPEPNHAPLQVIDGNYERMSGVCPWWDAVSAVVDRSEFTVATQSQRRPRAKLPLTGWLPSRSIPDERRKAVAFYRQIEIKPIAGALGAEIANVDLSTLDDETFSQIEAAWLEHLVVFFRNQTLTPEQQIAFAKRFGEIHYHPFMKGMDERPEILEIIKEEGDTRVFGEVWHTDQMFNPKPAKATILYAKETPDAGGDTLFANMYLAYDVLSDPMKEMLKGIKTWNVGDRKKLSQNDEIGSTRDGRYAGNEKMAAKVRDPGDLADGVRASPCADPS